MITINLDLILKILLSVSITILCILFFITLIKLISVISKINSLLQKNKEQLEKRLCKYKNVYISRGKLWKK